MLEQENIESGKNDRKTDGNGLHSVLNKQTWKSIIYSKQHYNSSEIVRLATNGYEYCNMVML